MTWLIWAISIRIWHFSPSVNSFFKRACATIQWGQTSDFFIGPFVYFHTTRVQIVKALARLRKCAGSPEPSLVAYVIRTIISWAGSYYYTLRHSLSEIQLCKNVYVQGILVGSTISSQVFLPWLSTSLLHSMCINKACKQQRTRHIYLLI